MFLDKNGFLPGANLRSMRRWKVLTGRTRNDVSQRLKIGSSARYFGDARRSEGQAINMTGSPSEHSSLHALLLHMD